jgi:DNA-binding NarL/FixJ family response regulator
MGFVHAEIFFPKLLSPSDLLAVRTILFAHPYLVPFRRSLNCEMLRLLIADSHTLFREGLRRLLDKSDTGVVVIGEAADGRETLRKVDALRPDLLVLDLVLSKLDGFEVLRRIKPIENVRRIILTAELREQEFDQALQLSVSGIVLKRAPFGELIKCIRLVSSGGSWINQDSRGDSNLGGNSSAVQPIPKRRHITAREMEIINTIAEGYTNKEIATHLSISEQTVKHHLANIFSKTGTSNRVELIHFAIGNKLLEV